MVHGCTLRSLLAVLAWAPCALPAGEPAVDESPAKPGEWGFRPADGKASPTSPPGFVWRPQRSAASYEIQIAREASFRKVHYAADGIRYNCHCPPAALDHGRWHWRFRYNTRSGATSPWSKARSSGGRGGRMSPREASSRSHSPRAALWKCPFRQAASSWGVRRAEIQNSGQASITGLSWTREPRKLDSGPSWGGGERWRRASPVPSARQ